MSEKKGSVHVAKTFKVPLEPTSGGTGISSYSTGDIIYSDSSNSLAKLSGNTTTTKKFISQTGSGSASAAPSWSTVSKSDVGLGNVEDTALSTWAGSPNISTTGSIDIPTFNGNINFSGIGFPSITSSGEDLTFSAFSCLGLATFNNHISIDGVTNTGVTGTGNIVYSSSPTLVTPVLGTPSSGTLTNCTQLPISTGVSGLGSGIATFLGTPSSANLSSALTDETGSGALVFGTSPSFTTSVNTGSTTFSVFNSTATTINAFGSATAISIGSSSGTTTINGALTCNKRLSLKGGSFVESIEPDSTTYYSTVRSGTMTQDDSSGSGSGSQIGELDTTTFSPSANIVNAYGKLISPTFTVGSGKSIGNNYSSVLSLTTNGSGTCFNNVTQKIFGPSGSGGTKTYGYGLQVFVGSGCSYNMTAYFDPLVGIGTNPTEALDVNGNIRSTGSIKSTSPSEGIGYSSGSGGTVTQLTSKSTSVTLNKVSGKIVMHNASLNGGSTVVFTLNNSCINDTDVLVTSVSGISYSSNYNIYAHCGSGSALIYVINRGITASEAVVINYSLIKGASS